MNLDLFDSLPMFFTTTLCYLPASLERELPYYNVVGSQNMANTMSPGLLDSNTSIDYFSLWKPNTVRLCPTSIPVTKGQPQELSRFPLNPSPQHVNQMEISRHINSLSFQRSWFWKTGDQVFSSLPLKEQSLLSQSSKSVLALHI